MLSKTYQFYKTIDLFSSRQSYVIFAGLWIISQPEKNSIHILQQSTAVIFKLNILRII